MLLSLAAPAPVERTRYIIAYKQDFLRPLLASARLRASPGREQCLRVAETDALFGSQRLAECVVGGD